MASKKVVLRFGKGVTSDKADYNEVLRFSDFPEVAVLKNLYSSVLLVDCEIDVLQVIAAGHSQLVTGGLFFVGLVPSDWTIAKLADKYSMAAEMHPFAFGVNELVNANIKPSLTTFEVDLALKDRRGADPSLGIITKLARANQSVVSLFVSVKYTLLCSGEAYGA